MEAGMRETDPMKTALTVVALTLGCLMVAGRLCAETEPQTSPTEAAPSAPGIIVTPPYLIQIRPETPPVSSPVRPDNLAPPQTCPATDHKLDLIG
jgi:hypothetical protein